MYSNFEQYGLMPKMAGLFRMDMHRHALRPGLEEVRLACTLQYLLVVITDYYRLRGAA